MLMAEGGFLLSPPDAPRSHAGGDPAPDPACAHLFLRGGAVSVAESVLAPPGPIPNPVVTQGSAGEYCGGDPVGGEAAADTAPPRQQVRTFRRGVEQRQLVGLITQRSRVRIPPPPPHENDRDHFDHGRF